MINTLIANELLNVHQNHVIFGGNANATTRYIEPTILDSITSSSKIMQDEIFWTYITYYYL